MELLDPKPNEMILDLGCGDGALPARLAAQGICITGVDSSAEQVAAARAKGLDAHVMDGHALSFDGTFDAVLSNAALHWMRDPDAVIEGVWRALKPGGRFAGDMGGSGNVAAIVTALQNALHRRGIDGAAGNPWYFPSAEEYGEKLRRHGFVVDRIGLFPRPTRLPGPLEDWLDTFGGAFFSKIHPAERAAAKAEIADEVRGSLQGGDGVWTAD